MVLACLQARLQSSGSRRPAPRGGRPHPLQGNLREVTLQLAVLGQFRPTREAVSHRYVVERFAVGIDWHGLVSWPGGGGARAAQQGK